MEEQNNDIQRKAEGELLDGRTFVIPSYQRGYRWKKKQVIDLLNDLYSFACKSEGEDGEFYCLQPIIVQENGESKWEVVDGQQRLTTIYILLRYILRKLRYHDEKEFYDDYRKKLFHLEYETRQGSEQFFDKMDEDISKTNVIDYAYIINAYHHIDEWFSEPKGAAALYEHYKPASINSPKGYAEELLKLLLNDGDNKGRSVQFIWYELSRQQEDGKPKNPIDEFVRINNGKIALTNAELIKGLFLQKKNFGSGEEDLKQIEIAMEWENIENELHRDDFWYYIRKKETAPDEVLPNRIDYLFSIEYKTDEKNWIGQSTVEKDNDDLNLKRLNQELSDKDRLFIYYNQKFEGLEGNALHKKIHEEWQKVLVCFRTLQDWYNDPEIYNYVGYLSQCGVEISAIYHHYVMMDDTEERDDFIRYLKEQVKYTLRGVKVQPSENKMEFPHGMIANSYKGGREGIYNALLFLNINMMNQQLKNATSHDSNIYKFPFDVFVSQNWDIEHIDSYTTNPLKKQQDQKKWLETEINGLGDELKEEDKTEVELLMSEAKYKEAIATLQKALDEDMDATEEEKNSIGNLTLLDSTTNRQYHNDLFILKRNRILNRIKGGIFVPSTTLYVFAKLFDESGKDLTKWRHDDKVKYHNYILKSLGDYISKEGLENE